MVVWEDEGGSQGCGQKTPAVCCCRLSLGQRTNHKPGGHEVKVVRGDEVTLIIKVLDGLTTGRYNNIMCKSY